MARDGWFDGKGYDLFKSTRSIRIAQIKEYWADGIIDEEEIKNQRQIIVNQLKQIEPKLDDTIHAALTNVFIDMSLLEEMIEYNRKSKETIHN